MNRAEFEADLVREGYEVRQGGIEPNVHRPAHTHDFDARSHGAGRGDHSGIWRGALRLRTGQLLQRSGRHHT